MSMLKKQQLSQNSDKIRVCKAFLHNLSMRSAIQKKKKKRISICCDIPIQNLERTVREKTSDNLPYISSANCNKSEPFG